MPRSCSQKGRPRLLKNVKVAQAKLAGFWVDRTAAQNTNVNCAISDKPMLQPEDAGRRLQVARKGLSKSGTARVDEHGDDGRLGSNSCNSSSRFGPTPAFKLVTPVRLPAGRFRLATRTYLKIADCCRSDINVE
jgi:hypothetical protein